RVASPNPAPPPSGCAPTPEYVPWSPGVPEPKRSCRESVPWLMSFPWLVGTRANLAPSQRNGAKKTEFPAACSGELQQTEVRTYWKSKRKGVAFAELRWAKRAAIARRFG